ncbi:threonine/serine exporter family protein [Effusibacillus dendaii]|uniref:Threonine/Serine exporter ThrE domain-containing protein n=1 Tax=Effusibacillus dendaii TaxID=2743772 RepID=A0A7I8DFP9_9BACL|nr:threonine/serine exporter family protein [Effusibacillus dendaii]BCJ87390.1 hypothetical protein skT53_23750 [Effusibacillus dendaii]
MIMNLILAYLGTVAYAIIYRVPKRALLTAGLVGAGASAIRSGVEQLASSAVAGAFLGAFFVSIASEMLARIQKLPATVFIVCGILMLVPGMRALSAMRFFMEKDYFQGISNGTETFLIAGGIAAGLVVGGALMRFGRRRQHVA